MCRGNRRIEEKEIGSKKGWDSEKGTKKGTKFSILWSVRASRELERKNKDAEASGGVSSEPPGKEGAPGIARARALGASGGGARGEA